MSPEIQDRRRFSPAAALRWIAVIWVVFWGCNYALMAIEARAPRRLRALLGATTVQKPSSKDGERMSNPSTDSEPLPSDVGPTTSHLDDRPACLVIHGLGGGPYELAPLIAALEAEGLHVLAPILPGHEGPGPVMPASRWQDWADAVIAAFDTLAQDGKPVVVIGFSTGGTLALDLATKRPVARQVLMAPFLAIRFSRMIPINPSRYLGLISRVMPNLLRRRPAIRDRALRKQLVASNHFRTFNLDATLSALELIDTVKPLVPTITTPTLILQGRRDTVVEPREAAWLLDHLGSSSKSLFILPHSDHLLALDRDRDEVLSRTLNFILDRHAPAIASAKP